MGLTGHHEFYLVVWRNWEWAEREQFRIQIFKQILTIFSMVISLCPVLKGFQSEQRCHGFFKVFPVLILNFQKLEKEKESIEDKPLL